MSLQIVMTRDVLCGRTCACVCNPHPVDSQPGKRSNKTSAVRWLFHQDRGMHAVAEEEVEVELRQKRTVIHATIRNHCAQYPSRVMKDVAMIQF